MAENLGTGFGLEGRGKEGGREEEIWFWVVLSLRCPWVGSPGEAPGSWEKC